MLEILMAPILSAHAVAYSGSHKPQMHGRQAYASSANGQPSQPNHSDDSHILLVNQSPNAPPLEHICQGVPVSKIKDLVPHTISKPVVNYVNTFNFLVIDPNSSGMRFELKYSFSLIKGYDFNPGTPLSQQAYMGAFFQKLGMVEIANPSTGEVFGRMFKYRNPKGSEHAQEKHLFTASVPYNGRTVDIWGCNPTWDLNFFNSNL